jgi:hypothetical protein
MSISRFADRLVCINHAAEELMEYVCLVYLEEKNMDALSKSESEALTNESLAYDEALRRSGHFIVAQALQSVEMATTVRVRNGKISTTDGPFAETKEHLGGFILIKAKDLDEALQIAAKIPMARLGSIEVPDPALLTRQS